ncbi:MAG TPA: amidohydrolase [Gemmatimonadales bacterium]|nr:amidohydrolase [Gemmatimonadales bacterium]
MTTLKLISRTGFAASLAMLGPAQQGSEPADLIFRNGRIYTANEQSPRAEAIALKGDKIVYVGKNDGVSRLIGPQTRVVDLKGATVLPGLTDAHVHLAGIGAREMTLNLEGTTTLEDFLAKVKARVNQARPGEWVTGRGWIETFWTPPVFPTRQNLDRIAPDNPVYLTRADGHASIVNSAALRLAGITRSTVAPAGGAINKDIEGEPTGMLIDRAQGLVGRLVPSPSDAERDQQLLKGAERELGLGWTQVQDANGSWADVERMRRLYREGKLKLRIYKTISGPGADATRLIQQGPVLGEFGGRLSVRTIKVVMDGALGSRGAALLAPYSDDPKNVGLVTADTAALKPMLIAALKNGIQVETHSIGDRGNRLTLDFYARAMKAVPPEQRKVAEPRWRDEHSQIVNPADIPRFKQLGIIASMQPSHAISDLYFAPARLGPARLKGAYAWQSFLKLGVPVAGGSDAPVERGEPMIEFYAAVARKDLQGRSGPDWHPEEKVTREQGLKLFTVYPAFAAFEEASRGTLEVGKLADLTILDQDIMTVPEAQILKTRTLYTVVGGEIVYSWE